MDDRMKDEIEQIYRIFHRGRKPHRSFAQEIIAIKDAEHRQALDIAGQQGYEAGLDKARSECEQQMEMLSGLKNLLRDAPDLRSLEKQLTDYVADLESRYLEPEPKLKGEERNGKQGD